MKISTILLSMGLSLPLAGTALAGGVEDAEKCYQATVPGSDITLERAIHYCTRAYLSGELSDDNLAVTITNRGLAYADMGEYDRAIHDYNQAIWIKPDFAAPYNNRGNAYFKKGEYDRAIRDYDEATRLDPCRGRTEWEKSGKICSGREERRPCCGHRC